MSATNAGNIALNLVLGNKSAFHKDVSSNANKAAGKMGSAFSSAFKKIGTLAATAFSVKAITAFSKECVNLASDLAEVQNVVDVTFGQGAAKINEWAKTTAKSVGVSELAAKQYSGTMGAMLKSMNISSAAALDMSMNIAELAGDMASFYNLETDEAFAKIRSGIAGETEPLKQLGINMSVVNLEAFAMSKGITKSFQAMTQAEQATLRYNYLLSTTADAQGDFSRTSGSWANQVKVLKLNFDTLKASVGQLVINALTPMLVQLNRLIEYANKAASALTKLFGGSEQSASPGAGAMSGVSSSAVQAAEDITATGDTAVKTAKKIKASFADIDEIHVLGQKDDAEGQSGGGLGSSFSGSSMSAVDTAATETENKLDRIKQKLGSLWNGFSAGFDKEKKKIKKLAIETKNIFVGIYKDIKSLGSPMYDWFSTDYMTYLQTYCFTAVGILTGLWESSNMVFSDIWNLAAFPMLQSFIILGLPMITQFSTEVVDTLGVAFTLVKELFDTVWKDAGPDALLFFSQIYTDVMAILSEKWEQYGKPIFDGIKEAITNVKNLFVNTWQQFLKPIWDNIMATADELWSKHLEPLVDNIADFVGEFVQSALDIYNEFIYPITQWLQNVFYPIFVNVFNNVMNVVKPIIEWFIDSINNFITVLKGLIQFITGVLTGDWEKAWTGVKNIFSGIWEQIKNTVRTPINVIIGGIENLVNGVVRGINKMITSINSLSFKIPEWVPDYGGKTLGFNIRQISEISIPRLAQGSWFAANNPTLAIVGDNTREGEIVTPESKIREQVELAMRQFGGRVSDSQLMQIIKQAIKEALKELENVFGGDWTIIIVDEDGNEKGSTIITAAHRKNRRDGKTVISLGV